MKPYSYRVINFGGGTVAITQQGEDQVERTYATVRDLEAATHIVNALNLYETQKE